MTHFPITTGDETDGAVIDAINCLMDALLHAYDQLAAAHVARGESRLTQSQLASIVCDFSKHVRTHMRQLDRSQPLYSASQVIDAVGFCMAQFLTGAQKAE